MIDTSGIDIKAVIDQLCCVQWGRESTVSGKRQIKGGPCPLCHQGRDRFIIWPHGDANNPNPRFYCGIHGNGCGAHGDVIRFVQLLKGYTTAYQAIRDLYVMGFVVGGKHAGSTYTPAIEKDAPSAKWQEQGQTLVHAAQRYLWSPVGEKVLDYLHQRGLTDETIKQFSIGYWPQWQEQPCEWWGIAPDDITSTLWIRPGIVIPTFEHETLWKITIRILEHTPRELARARDTGKILPRYRQVTGSRNSLFNVDAILPYRPVFLTEGEFDAMIGQQETGFPFVATGSTGGSMLARWIARLALAPHVLLAFDNDDGKGARAAQEWCKIFGSQALLWLPTATKDITDMWLQKQDIKQWALIAYAGCLMPGNVENAQEEDVAPTQTQDAPEVEFTQDMEPLCYECLNEDIETPARWFGPDDTMYCRTHYDALPSDFHRADTERIAEKFKQALPGWKVTVEPRCTLAEYIARMKLG